MNADEIKSKIRNISNFPKPGIEFKDITTLLKDKEAFKSAIDLMAKELSQEKIDYVVAIESRGYLLGAPLAYKLGAGLVLVRKPGKLPAAVERIEYDLEYGTDVLEIHKDSIEEGKKVLVIDDLLATGGTVKAAIDLVKKVGGDVIGAAFLIELEALGGKKKIPEGTKLYSLFKYE